MLSRSRQNAPANWSYIQETEVGPIVVESPESLLALDPGIEEKIPRPSGSPQSSALSLGSFGFI